jgi:DHA1 family tetracycline resistance protein-like MFS transporter
MPGAKPSKHALTFVLLTVTIDMIGMGIIMPVLPGMIGSIAGVGVSDAARIGGWLLVAYSAMQFLFGPVIGNLSDAYGRRPVLLLSILGLGIDYAVIAFAPSIGWLFLGRFIAGACGASYTTANAFIADVTAPEDRAKAFGLIGAAFGIGFVVGPALGGLMAGFGHRAPFFVAAALSLLNAAYGFLVLPESLPAEKRRPFRMARANPLGALLAFRRHPIVLAYGLTLFLHFLATNAYPAVWAYYTIYRYGWSEWQVGLSLALFGAVTAGAQGGLVGPFIARFGERAAAIVSLIVEVVIALGYAFATQGWMIYVLLVVGALQGIAMPAINALMTRQVGEDAQGELQGAIAGIIGITAVVGPLLATQLFAGFTGPSALLELPGAPFVATALLSLLALGVFARARPRPGEATDSTRIATPRG